MIIFYHDMAKKHNICYDMNNTLPIIVIDIPLKTGGSYGEDSRLSALLETAGRK